MRPDDIDWDPALREVYGDVPADLSVHELTGDASTRTYYRLVAPGRTPERLVLMHLPQDALGSDEGDGSERARELPFLNVQRVLAARGVPVPEVLAADVPRRVVLLEDLGDETFHARVSRPGARRREMYEAAIDLLADLHERCAEPAPGCLAYERSFDGALLRWELDHFREWGLEVPWGALPPSARGELDRLFDELTEALVAMPTGFVHRDYQSKNLMWSGERLVVIDFQDALSGPRPYDLVALLCDSYVDLDEPLQRAMLARYCAQRGLSKSDTTSLIRDFWRVAVQRKLKDAGRFVFIDRVRGNPSFLQHYSQSIVYVGRALSRVPDLAPIARLLERHLPGFPDAAPTPTPAGAPPTAHGGE